jgi:predicted P-loop ATPase
MKPNNPDGVLLNFGKKDTVESIITARSKKPRKPRQASAGDPNKKTTAASDQPLADAKAGADQVAETDWRDFLIRKKKKPVGCLANVIAALTYADEWRGVLAFDEYSLELKTRSKTPWEKPIDTRWTDTDDSRLAAWLQRFERIIVGSKLAGEAVQVVARNNSYHSLQNRIAKLQWDNQPRIDTWLIVYLGAPDTPYVRAVGACWLISLMARLWEPGCKADYVLMLEGPQGIKKSTALSLLVGEDYFSDRISDPGTKDCMLELAGMWLIELSEIENYLHDVRSRNRFKSFVTSRNDYFRDPYGRRPVAHLRHCVLAATTNSSKTFADPTGTRRIWPVECGNIDLVSLKKDADQLLAEACARYRKGEKWYLETAELETLAAEEQDERYEPGVWDSIIADWIEKPIRGATLEGQTHIDISPWDESESGKVTITDILVHGVGKDRDKLTQADYKQVSRWLEHEKWKQRRNKTRGPNRDKRYYYSPGRWEKQQW